MEREVWARGAMVSSILALVVLIAVTPVLLGKPTSELESLPILIIGMSRSNDSWFILELGAALQHYRYDFLRLTIFNASAPSANASFNRTDAYSLSHWVPTNVTFSVNVYVVDRDDNYFESNLSARVESLDGRMNMVFTLLDERNNGLAPIRRVQPPDDYDFAFVIPRRGNLR